MIILIAEDDSGTRKGLRVFLESEGHTVFDAANGQEALDLLDEHSFDLLLSDVKMPVMDGLELLKLLREKNSDFPVLMMTAFATVEEAVKALQHGAQDYLTKPLNLNELSIKLERLAERVALYKENISLKKKLHHFEFPEMIGVSESIRRVQQSISSLSPDSDVPVMIYGESGTGKELVARTLHKFSERREEVFLAVNCAAFQDNLLESELFGHKKGAFTGAIRDKIGFFEAADRGTLFLDEVSEMSGQMQSKLLRTLQEQTIVPLGSTDSRNINVRIICASNRNLYKMVEEKEFREDLFYRLNVFEIDVPPLRERKEDIPLLTVYFAEKYRGESVRPQFKNDFLHALNQYYWPGNVRELENLIRMMLATTTTGEFELDDLPEKFRNTSSHKAGEQQDWLEIGDYKKASDHAKEAFEKVYLKYHLERHSGNITHTARSIGMSRVTLHEKINKYKLHPQED